MTANDIYKHALALLNENPENTRDFNINIIELINILLSDCFELNNSIRIYKQKEKLKEIGYISTLSDEIIYEHEIAMDTLPYGLASMMILEDDMTRAGFFDFRYQQKKLFYNKTEIQNTEDLYI